MFARFRARHAWATRWAMRQGCEQCPVCRLTSWAEQFRLHRRHQEAGEYKSPKIRGSWTTWGAKWIADDCRGPAGKGKSARQWWSGENCFRSYAIHAGEPSVMTTCRNLAPIEYRYLIEYKYRRHRTPFFALAPSRAIRVRPEPLIARFPPHVQREQIPCQRLSAQQRNAGTRNGTMPTYEQASFGERGRSDGTIMEGNGVR